MAQIQWLESLYVGRGINPATGEIFQPAIDYASVESVDSGQKPKLDLKIISSSKQLANLLSVDAAASLRVKTKGNVSAQASFSDQQQVNSYYQYALVTVGVTNPTKTIRNPVLKQDARQLLESDGWEEFAKSYGLEFVESYIPGGYYYALIEIQTTDSSKQQEIAAQLSASYSNFGADAKVTAEASNQIKTALKDQKISVSVCQSGGSGDPLEVTLDKMIEQAINFTLLIKENPVPMIAITNTYRRGVPNLPKARNPNFSLMVQTTTLDELGEQYLELDDYKSNLEFVLKNLNQFSEYDDLKREEKRKEFQESLNTTKKVINGLIRTAKECSNDCEKCSGYTLPENFKYLPLPSNLTTDLPTRVNGTSVIVPINSSSLAKLQEYDVRNQNKFEVEVKLSTAISETQSPGAARFIGLGISSTKSGKTVSIVSGITANGRLLIANASGTPNPIYRPDPGDVVYLKITKEADEFNLFFSRDGLSFESLLKSKLTALGFPVDDTYKVFLGGNSTDSTPISGKFSDLIIT